MNITSGPDLMMAEVRKISETVKQQVHPEAEIIFGTTQDLRMENELKITIIATGFEDISDVDAYGEERAQKAQAELENSSDLNIPPSHRSIEREYQRFLRGR